MTDKAKQKKRIVEYLQKHGTITQQEASVLLSVTRLPSRIFDLKADGYTFSDEMVTAVNQFGDRTHYKRYNLEGAPK